MSKGWTVSEVRESAWAKSRLNEPWAVRLSPSDYGDYDATVEILPLSRVLDLAEKKRLGPSEVPNLPYQIASWMGILDLASIYALEKATLSLSRDQRLDMLSRWFNSGGGLPSPSTQPGSKYENNKIRLFLGHPALLNQFLRWLIRYLGTHESIDGRIDQDCESMINLARELQDKAPVRRY